MVEGKRKAADAAFSVLALVGGGAAAAVNLPGMLINNDSPLGAVKNT